MLAYTPVMTRLIRQLVSFISSMRHNVMIALLVLFLVRLLGILTNLHGKFGEVWRQRNTQSEWSSYLLVIAGIIVLSLLQQQYRRFSPALKKSFLTTWVIGYLLLAFFNNRISSASYLYHLLRGQLDFDTLLQIITPDLFFDPPFIFWSLLWLTASYLVCRRFDDSHWLLPLWSVPLLFLPWHHNHLLLAFILSILPPCLIAGRLWQSNSARKILLFFGLSLLCAIAYLFSRPEMDLSSLLAASTLFALAWLPAYWFGKKCEDENSASANVVGWLVPVLFCVVLHQILFNAGTARNIFNFWFVFASFSFASGIFLSLFLALILPALIAPVSHRISRLLFNLTVFLLILFYLADGITVKMLGLRLSLNTVVWVKSYLFSILKTAATMLEWRFVGSLLIFPLLYLLLLRQRPADTKSWRIPETLRFMIVLSVFTATFHQALMFIYPPGFIDPARFFIASVPLPEFLRPPRPELAEITSGLSDVGTPLRREIFSSAQIEPGRPKNLILVMLESVSNEYLSLFGHPEPTTPRLKAYGDRLEIFPLIFCNFPESSNADFSLVTGLHPPTEIYLIEKPEYHARTMIEMLNDAGYHSTMFSSGFIADSGLASFYRPRGFSQIFDPNLIAGLKSEDYWDWGIKKHVMIDKILEHVADVTAAGKQPFFVYYRTAFPHLPFVRVTAEHAVFSEDDYLTGSLVGRYKNCLHYLDEQLARLIAGIERAGLRENTIIAFVGDHGTLLGKPEQKGQTGHGFNIYPELINIPFIIVHPEAKGLKINSNFGSQADIMPTLLNLIGWKGKPKSFIQGDDLRAKNAPAKPIYFSALSSQRGIMQNGHYFVFHQRESADAHIYKIGLEGTRPIFKQLTQWDPQDLWNRHRRTYRFFELQNNLLDHMEDYEKEYRSIEAAGNTN